jgi:hypothetical protein
LKVYVGGAFDSIGGLARTNLAEVDPGTARVTDWRPNPDGVVYTLEYRDYAIRGAALPTIYVGGKFTHIGIATSDEPDPVRYRAAEVNISDNGTVTAWNPSLTFGGTPSTADNVYDFLALPSARGVIIGGAFSCFRSAQDPTKCATSAKRSRLGESDASVGNPDDWNPSLNKAAFSFGYCSTAPECSTPTLAVGGQFTSVNTAGQTPVTRNGLAFFTAHP